jgi:hypothetical protein
VEELAEVLAVNFDDAEGIPKLNPGWRWEDQEQALLTSCSSLIVIVDTGNSRIVQFSHFSVKEFLTSARLATSTQDVSRYHIVLGPAHMILAQACLSVLLRLDNLVEDSSIEDFPLAGYAVEHWVRHAQFEDVASRVKGMEYLFDLDKPHFAAWRRMHDIDTPPYDSVFYPSFYRRKADAKTPLYYAALCGFPNLVEQLIVKHPRHVEAIGGYFMTPAVAALAGRHFQVAQVLHRNGSSVDPRSEHGNSTLHSAAYCGDLEMVRVLLDYGVDANAVNDAGSSPLYFASIDVVRLLLDHGADPNIHWQMLDLSTPLHSASIRAGVAMARLLVEHGASVEAKDAHGRTPLDYATEEQHDDIIKLLVEHGAK